MRAADICSGEGGRRDCYGESLHISRRSIAAKIKQRNTRQAFGPEMSLTLPNSYRCGAGHGLGLHNGTDEIEPATINTSMSTKFQCLKLNFCMNYR